MRTIDDKRAIRLLKKHSSDANSYKHVLSHSRAVQKLAVIWARKTISNGHPVDVKFVSSASLLHDIGRFVHPPGKKTILHGVAGARILRREGLDKRYSLVCERHLGAGITKKEVIKKKLPLPARDYVPLSIEEKIIAHADNLHWGAKKITSRNAIDRFRKEIGKECAGRVKKLDDEIMKMIA